MSPKTQVAISFMEDNLDRAIPIEEIARLVKLSRSRLCYLFKAEVGLPPTQYLKKVRMEKALELLRTSFLDIKEVAAKVGYNDSTHFMREFKKAYGSTPSQHRAGYRSDGPGKDESR
jgi:AraC-like DNA-binding protein